MRARRYTCVRNYRIAERIRICVRGVPGRRKSCWHFEKYDYTNSGPESHKSILHVTNCGRHALARRHRVCWVMRDIPVQGTFRTLSRRRDEESCDTHNHPHAQRYSICMDTARSPSEIVTVVDLNPPSGGTDSPRHRRRFSMSVFSRGSSAPRAIGTSALAPSTALRRGRGHAPARVPEHAHTRKYTDTHTRKQTHTHTHTHINAHHITSHHIKLPHARTGRAAARGTR